MNDEFEERRRHKRYELNLTVQASHKEEGLKMKTANISLGGAYCRVNRYIPEMTKLNIRIDTTPEQKESNWLETEAVVVRVEPDRKDCDEYHIALYFQHLNDENQKKLKALFPDMSEDESSP